jgi:hypothetical protein
LLIEKRLKSIETRSDGLGGRELAGDGFRSFQAVAGDRNDSSFLWLDTIL